MLEFFKFLHIFGVIIFLGNIIVTFFWKIMANRSKDPAVLAFSQRLVTKTDRVFTAVGATMLSIGGYGYAHRLELDVSNSWMLWAQVTFYASAAIWALILLPIQHKQSRLADEFVKTREIPSQYWTLTNYWNLVGVVAVILPLMSLYLMVVQPG